MTTPSAEDVAAYDAAVWARLREGAGAELSDAERAILLAPCACGHTINDHGSMIPCWLCEDEGGSCAVTFEALLCERVARIVTGRSAEGLVPRVPGPSRDGESPQWDRRPCHECGHYVGVHPESIRGCAACEREGRACHQDAATAVSP
jgi:hypothetical protein